MSETCNVADKEGTTGNCTTLATWRKQPVIFKGKGYYGYNSSYNIKEEEDSVSSTKMESPEKETSWNT